jgi:hypothetical protein
LIFLPPLFWANLPYTSNIPSTKPHIQFLSLRSFIQRIRPGSRLLAIFCNKFIFYDGELLAPRPTPKLSGTDYSIYHSYLPYLKAVSSIRNLTMRHPVVTMDPPNMRPYVLDPSYSYLQVIKSMSKSLKVHNH